MRSGPFFFYRGVPVRWLGLALLAGGCSYPDQNEFVDTYTDSYCTYFMDCIDPAILTFDGYTEVEQCVLEFKVEFALAGLDCKYKGRAAEACLQQMEQLSCPDPLAVTRDELPLPVVCVEEVWLECGAAEGQSPTDGDDGEGSDTDDNDTDL